MLEDQDAELQVDNRWDSETQMGETNSAFVMSHMSSISEGDSESIA